MTLRIQSSDQRIVLSSEKATKEHTLGNVSDGNDGFIYSGATPISLNKCKFGVTPTSI